MRQKQIWVLTEVFNRDIALDYNYNERVVALWGHKPSEDDLISVGLHPKTASNCLYVTEQEVDYDGYILHSVYPGRRVRWYS